MELYKVLERPLITEKTTQLASRNQYTFQVARDSNKALIKQAVEERFAAHKVKVAAVNVINVHPKQKGAGRRRGMAPGWKKAIVTLKEGTIPEFTGNV